MVPDIMFMDHLTEIVRSVALKCGQSMVDANNGIITAEQKQEYHLPLPSTFTHSCHSCFGRHLQQQNIAILSMSP
jgi:hypothetical protein